MLIYQRVILLSKTVDQRIKDRKDLGWTVLKVKKTFPTIQVQHFHTPNDWNDIKHMETKTIFFLRNQRRTLVWDDPWNNHLEIIKNSHGGDSLGYYSPVTSFFCWHPESIDAELFKPSGTKRTMTLTCHELLFNRHVKS